MELAVGWTLPFFFSWKMSREWGWWLDRFSWTDGMVFKQKAVSHEEHTVAGLQFEKGSVYFSICTSIYCTSLNLSLVASADVGACMFSLKSLRRVYVKCVSSSHCVCVCCVCLCLLPKAPISHVLICNVFLGMLFWWDDDTSGSWLSPFCRQIWSKQVIQHCSFRGQVDPNVIPPFGVPRPQTICNYCFSIISQHWQQNNKIPLNNGQERMGISLNDR